MELGLSQWGWVVWCEAECYYCVWAKSGRWQRIGKPGMLQSMWLQSVGHGWATEQQQWKENSSWGFLWSRQDKRAWSSISQVFAMEKASWDLFPWFLKVVSCRKDCWRWSWRKRQSPRFGESVQWLYKSLNLDQAQSSSAPSTQL